MSDYANLVLRLAGPLQAWGSSSQFNVRQTDDRPTKSGLVGLLAAAQGLSRGASIAHLVGLAMAVRVDQPGSQLRDYHTVSTLDGSPLLSTAVNAKGLQKTTSPKKFTHVTQRFYLQDSVFVGVVNGPAELVESLAAAVRRPKYALFLGRRSCVPTGQMVVASPSGQDVWPGSLEEVIAAVPWQAGPEARRSAKGLPAVGLAATIELPDGDDVALDVPASFAHDRRGFQARTVKHTWIEIPTGEDAVPDSPSRAHDPFELLGW